MIDNYGSFSSDTFPHIYPFVQEYSTSQRTFRLPFRVFDDSSLIELRNQGVFHKTYRLDDDIVESKHIITTLPNAIKWKVAIEAATEPVRFGIAIKTDKIPVRLYDKTNPMSILINYNKHWIPTWPKQVNTDIPVIFSEIHGQNLTISTPMSNTVQFHQYKDKDNRYVSVSSTTSMDDSIEVLLEIGQVKDAKQHYCQMYPECVDLIFPSKIIFNKMNLKYGIKIQCRSVNCGSFYGRNPTLEEIEQYLPILNGEISRYPRCFFLAIDLNEIILSSDISNESAIAIGFSGHNELILNISEHSILNKRIAIHHEIFHLIEKKIGFLFWNNETDIFMQWNQLRFGRRLLDIQEYKANLFAYKLLEPKLIEHLRVSDKIFDSKCKMMDNFIESIGLNILPVSTSFFHTPINIDARERLQNESDLFIKKLPNCNNSTKWILVGMKGIALDTVRKLLKNKLKIIEVNKQNINEILKDRTANIMLVVRNPIDWAISCGEDTEQYLTEWINVHKILFPKSIWHIRYEDIVQFNLKALKRAFDLLGQNICMSDLNFVDVEDAQPYNRAELCIRSLWDNLRTEECIKHLGYANYSCED